MASGKRRWSGRRWRTAVALGATLAFAASGPGAGAHEERPTEFPDGSGSVPQYRPMVASPHLVVCKNESAKLIGRIKDSGLRQRNQQLLEECRFRHIQEAVDAVSQRGTTIYVLPGTYREEPSRPQPACAAALGDRHVLSYTEQRSCPHAQNLIGIFGDANPGDGQRRCDAPVCGLQIEGTGASRRDVLIRGGFDPDKSFTKLNGIRADRADGVYLRNFTIELFEFNAVYVLESDGFVIDDVLARYNDEYGFLTFAVDHGLYDRCEAHGNGDGALYPGSASDLNAGSTQPPPLGRWAVEIRNCKGHHSLLGYSGTAGNSVYAHDNEFFANTTGVVMDSVFPDHPGLPQDHAWFENNRIHSNNVNFYERDLYSGKCDRPPADRGYERGTVCPSFLTPVGTGVMIAGGNYNLFHSNSLYDNWRSAFMQFNVPASLRGEEDPNKQFDTSHHNQYRENRLGLAPNGKSRPNGLDVWWDDQGVGNCWQENVSSHGTVTNNAMPPYSTDSGLPDCDSGGSSFFPSAPNPAKSSQIASCATYDRNDPAQRRPPGCDWYETPSQP